MVFIRCHFLVTGSKKRPVSIGLRNCYSFLLQDYFDRKRFSLFLFISWPSSPKWTCGPITYSGMENIPRARVISCVARASKRKGTRLPLLIRNRMSFWILEIIFDGLTVLKSTFKTNQVELNVNGFCSQSEIHILIKAAKAPRSSVRDYCGLIKWN